MSFFDPTHAASHADVLEAPSILQTLRETPAPDSGVLSAYLATPLMPVAGRSYLSSFREACKTLRATLPGEVHKEFENAVTQAEGHLGESFVPRQPGLALFASGDPKYFQVVALPCPPHEEVAWGSEPVLAPLQAILDDYERIAVALFDQQRARIFSVFLGVIEESQTFEADDPGETDPSGRDGRPRAQRQTFTGGAPGNALSGGGGGVSRARYVPQLEDYAAAHARDIADALTTLLNRRPFNRLLLAGPVEAVALLRDTLPEPLVDRVAGELPLAMSASDAEVLRAATDAALAIEREAEVKMIDELVAAATTPLATLGFGATLAALSDKRVRQLFIADTFAGIGGECPVCGRLVAGPGRCPACNSKPTPLGDLRERLVDRALEQSAEVETVSGEAASLLAVHGGLGAWTRY